MLRPVRTILACAAAVLLLLSVAACETVGAQSATIVERNGMATFVTTSTLTSSIATAPSHDSSASAPILDDSSIEPTDPLDAAAAPTAVETTAFPTVSIPPMWAPDFTGIIDGVRTNRRVVALTFDDGPTAHTKQIVNELVAAGAHATFFWVGSQITTEAARYSIAHNEEIANHTWSHPNMRHLTSEEASEEIGFTNARIAQVTGHTPTWFRSPFNRLYRVELEQIQAHGLLYANYNVTSIDWMKGMTDADVLSKISQNLQPGGVILMHDSPKHNPKVLPSVLRLLHRRGYQVVTMTKLAQMGPPVDEPLRLGVGGLGY